MNMKYIWQNQIITEEEKKQLEKTCQYVHIKNQ